MIEKERSREWTLPERLSYTQGFDKLAEFIRKPKRQATQAEIDAIESLREQAYLSVGLPFKKNLIAQEVNSLASSPSTNVKEPGNKATFTVEQESRYKIIIKKYKQLKHQRDQHPYPRSKQQSELEKHAHKMSQRPRLMQYIQQKYPKIEKNIKKLARSHNLSPQLDR